MSEVSENRWADQMVVMLLSLQWQQEIQEVLFGQGAYNKKQVKDFINAKVLHSVSFNIPNFSPDSVMSINHLVWGIMGLFHINNMEHACECG